MNVIPTPNQHAAMVLLAQATLKEGVWEWSRGGISVLVNDSGGLRTMGLWAEREGLIEVATVRKTGQIMLRLTEDGRKVREMQSRRFELWNGRDALLIAVEKQWVAGMVKRGSTPTSNYIAAQPKLDTIGEAVERLLNFVTGEGR